MFALILGNKVVDIAATEFPAPASMSWQECPDNVVAGWYYVGGQFRESLRSDTEFLTEIKRQKIAEIKAVRDWKNVEPITDTKARIIDADGNVTAIESFFVFHTSRHPTNPASDPASILTGSVVLNISIPYSSKNENGEKVNVSITPAIARNLATHIAHRNNMNYKLADAIEAFIKAATTPAAVREVTWNVRYLD